MTRVHSGEGPAALAPEQAELLAIADLIDVVCERRSELHPEPVSDDTRFRRGLFALLDEPTATHWAEFRHLELIPHFVPGLPTPSPVALTVGDIVYAYGLSDVATPSRETLMAALAWAAREYRVIAEG